jgi:diacylglycerol kinase
LNGSHHAILSLDARTAAWYVADVPIVRAPAPAAAGEVMYSGSPLLSDEDAAAEQPRPRRPWRAKFRDAFRGLKLGVRGHSSFSVHFFFAALVVAAAIVLRCTVIEWGILLLCIGLVLTAELFNSAIETLFRGLDETARDRCWQALDIAAGAVLCASLVSAAVGLAIFTYRLVVLLGIEP